MTHGRLVSIDSRESQADLEVVHPATGERAQRGLKRFGIFFGIAICVVPVPPHVILPSISLIVGIVLGIKTFLETKLIRSGVGPCPVCGNPVTFVNVAVHETNKTLCQKCRNQLRLIVE